MRKIIFYGYPKCSTCRKASNWLEQKGIEYQFIDIIEKPPSVKYLECAHKQYSLDIKKVFNTRSKSFKCLELDFLDISKEKIIKILSSDGKLIKRPFLVFEEKTIILGFNESEYQNLLKLF